MFHASWKIYKYLPKLQYANEIFGNFTDPARYQKKQLTNDPFLEQTPMRPSKPSRGPQNAF